MAHFASIRGAEKFIKFDYGSDDNLKIYGQRNPPEINLKDIKDMPRTALFVGEKDDLAHPEAGRWLKD